MFLYGSLNKEWLFLYTTLSYQARSINCEKRLRLSVRLSAWTTRLPQNGFP